MWQAISVVPVRVYLAFAGFLGELKRDERGLSGVVVTVLLILIAVLAVVLIWGFLSGWLQELWERIVGEAGGVA